MSHNPVSRMSTILSIYVTIPAVLDPRVYSPSNRNEYTDRSKKVSGQ
jgi:hypothetical protein